MIKVAIPITGINEFKSLKKVVLSGKFVSGENVEILKKIMLNLLAQNTL